MMRFHFLIVLVLSAAALSGQVVSDGGIVNGASFAPGQPIAPGSIVSIFGSDLASGVAAASSVPLSTSLGDVASVTFNGIPAPLFFVSQGQINAQVPWGVMPQSQQNGTATVVVTRSTGAQSQGKDTQIAPMGPGIFSVPPGRGYGIAINLDGTVAAPVGAISGLNTHPAKPGDIIQVLASGLGAVDQPVSDGGTPQPGVLAHTKVMPIVLIGGMQSEVQFSGLTPQFVAVYQLNVKIPDSVQLGDKVPIQVQMGNVTSTDQVTIAISQ